MQTPEEFAADMHASMLSCDREELIRARDAEVEVRALRNAADEFAGGARVMERWTRGLVAARLRDQAHRIERGD